MTLPVPLTERDRLLLSSGAFWLAAEEIDIFNGWLDSHSPVVFKEKCMVDGFDGKNPLVREAAFIAWNAHVSGDVELGKDASVWYGSTIRADIDAVRVGERTNVQDGAVLHVSSGYPCIVGSDVTIGHGSIVHACRIGDRCLVGMGAIVLDGAQIGDDSIVGAGALVTGGKSFPPGSMILGSPAKAVRQLTEHEKASIVETARRYVELAWRTASGATQISPEIEST